jgi:hypothetical protein
VVALPKKGKVKSTDFQILIVAKHSTNATHSSLVFS